jgi:hypothetical protein
VLVQHFLRNLRAIIRRCVKCHVCARVNTTQGNHALAMTNSVPAPVEGGRGGKGPPLLHQGSDRSTR